MLSSLPTLSSNVAHPHVTHSTGTAVEYGVVDLMEANCTGMDAIYKAIYPKTGLDAEQKDLLKSSKGPLWENACVNKFGCMARGNLPDLPKGTDTMHFIYHLDMPDDCKATYLKNVSADKPHRAIKECVPAIVGGDRVNYPGETSTKTSDLVMIKLLLKNTKSTPSTLCMSNDIKDFYLNTPMDGYEYMLIQYGQIPNTIKRQ
jgi:hypothetical protein